MSVEAVSSPGDVKKYDVSETVTIHVRGRRFHVNKSDLARHPGSTIAQITQRSAEADVIVNRNPALIPHIIRYYSHGELHLPAGYCRILLMQELDFWGLSYRDVSPCCQKRVARDLSIYPASVGYIKPHGAWEAYTTFDTIWGKLLYIFSFVLHTALLMTFLYSGNDTYLEKHRHRFGYNGNSYDNYNRESKRTPTNGRAIADLMFVILLTLWYVLWIVICPARRQYYVTGKQMTYPIIILLQWIPSCLELADRGSYPLIVYFFIYLISLGRIFMFGPLIKQWRYGKVILGALSRSWREMILMVNILLLLGTIFGYIVYSLDKSDPDSQFSSFSLWWALVTMTTVGYGDFVPTSLCAKAVASLCAYAGVIIMVVMLAVIWRNFNTICQEEDDRVALEAMKGSGNASERLTSVYCSQVSQILCSGSVVMADAEQSSGNSRLSQAISEGAELTAELSTLHHVLDYFNIGVLHLPDGCPGQLESDLALFEINETEVARCCRGKVVRGVPSIQRTGGYAIQSRLWDIYMFKRIDIPSVVLHLILWCVYLLYLMPLLLSTYPIYKHYKIYTVGGNASLGPDHTIIEDDEPSVFSNPFFGLELSMLIILTVWFVAVIVICPARMKVLFHEHHFIFPFVVFIQWFPLVYKLIMDSSGMDPNWLVRLAVGLFCTVAEISRTLLFFYLYTRWRCTRLVLLALKRSLGMIIVVFCLVCLVASGFAFVVLILESDSMETHYRWFSDGMWWAVMTVLTVGYGDVRPIGVLGKMVGMACCLFGLLFLALPVPELLRNYQLVHEEDREKREKPKPGMGTARQPAPTNSESFV